MNNNFKIGPLIYASNYLIKGLCVIFFIGVCLDASAQTKKTIEYKAPNFGCTFEDGPFKAMIKVEQKGQPKINLEFSTNVEIQGCQVIHIDFDKIDMELVANFKPTDIEDSGNVIILTDRGIKYEIHLILP